MLRAEKYRQQLLIGLNREIARQLLQSPFDLVEPTAAAASDEAIVAELEALEEQNTLTAVLLSDADKTMPNDIRSMLRRRAAHGARAALSHHPPANIDAQPPVDGEPIDVLMQDVAPGRVALDCSMSEAAPLEG